jgi:uncharacterized protein YbjT (DUF2867 family)
MKIIVVGATGTLGSAVVKALVSKGHEVIATSRKSEASVNLEDSASVEELFAGARDVGAVVSCAGDAIFRPFGELTDADFALCVRSKMMGQVNLVRTAAKHLRDAGSVTITSGMASTHRRRAPPRSRSSTRGSKVSCALQRSKCRAAFGSTPCAPGGSRKLS